MSIFFLPDASMNSISSFWVPLPVSDGSSGIVFGSVLNDFTLPSNVDIPEFPVVISMDSPEIRLEKLTIPSNPISESPALFDTSQKSVPFTDAT